MSLLFTVHDLVPAEEAGLVGAVEARAQARGCSTFYLQTFSFQAPSLYRSLGYEVTLALDGFAPGIVKYTMVRRPGPRETGA